MKFASVFLFALFSFTHITAQTNTDWVNYVSHEHVNDVVETSEDMWIATTGGLVHLWNDGNNIEYFNRGNSAIPSNDVRYLVRDKHDVLWLSTPQGLASYDAGTWQQYDTLGGMLALNTDGEVVVAMVEKIYQRSDQSFVSIEYPAGLMPYFVMGDFHVNPANGDMWLAIWSFGYYNVLRYSNGTWTEFNHNNSVLPWESPNSNSFTVDSNGKVWLLNWGGLFAFENEEWSDQSSLFVRDPSFQIMDIASDGSGNILIFGMQSNPSNQATLITIDANENTSTEVFPIQFEKLPYANKLIFSQERNDLIACFSNVGLWTREQGDWQKMHLTSTGFTSNEINVSTDQNNGIWLQFGFNFPFYPKDVARYTNGTWSNLSGETPFRFLDNRSFRIMSYGANRNWVYINDTLYVENNGIWSVADVPEILNDVRESNSFIHIDHNGATWLLERYTSHIFYDGPNGWELFDHPEHGAVSGQYQSYFNHPQTNDFWLSSYNGLSVYEYNTREWHHTRMTDIGLPSNHVDICQDPNGNVYGITREYFFQFIDRDEISIIATADEIYGDTWFFSLNCDQDGTIWLGMNGAIASYTGGAWNVLTNQNSGVPNGFIRTISFDAEDNMWIGSETGGLAIYNPGGLTPNILQGVTLSNGESEVQSNHLEFSVFPNPSNRIINLKLPNVQEEYSVTLFNSVLQPVLHRQNVIGDTTLDANNLPKGAYILQVTSRTDGQMRAQTVLLY